MPVALWGYLESDESGEITKIYLADGTPWGEARFNAVLNRTDIYQY